MVICAILLLMCLITSSTVLFTLLNHTRNLLITDSRNSLDDTITEVVHNLNDLIRSYNSKLDYIASNYRITTYLNVYNSLYPTARLALEHEIRQFIANVIAMDSNIVDVFILNEDVVLNNYNSATVIADYDYTASEWYRAIYEQRNFHMSAVRLDFYINSPLINMEAVVMGAPIYSYDGSFVGAVCLFVESDMLKNVPLSSKGLKDGEAYYVIANDGRTIASFCNPGAESMLLPQFNAERSMMLNADDIWIHVPLLSGGEYKIIGHISLLSIHERMESLQRQGFVLATSITALCVLLFICLYLFFNRKLNGYLEYLAAIEAGSAPRTATCFREANDLARHFHQLVSDLKAATEQIYAYELEHSRIQLDMLISQINPHFLFNALQFLQSEIMYGDRNRANSMLVSLSDLLRFTLNTNNYVSTVREEVVCTKNYLDICQRCYGNHLQVTIDVSESLDPLLVPKFLIQPIAENSIKHGFDGVPHWGSISILGERQDNQMRFIIEDNGHGLSAEGLNALKASLNNPAKSGVPKQHIGLANIYQRLKLLFGSRFTMRIESEEERFFRITFVIPIDSHITLQRSSQLLKKEEGI